MDRTTASIDRAALSVLNEISGSVSQPHTLWALLLAVDPDEFHRQLTQVRINDRATTFRQAVENHNIHPDVLDVDADDLGIDEADFDADFATS